MPEPIDFAAVKAEHEGHGPGCTKWKGNGRGCLPYRLAEEAERLAGKVARVESLAERLERAERGISGFLYSAGRSVPSVTAPTLRAALDDPEQEQG